MQVASVLAVLALISETMLTLEMIICISTDLHIISRSDHFCSFCEYVISYSALHKNAGSVNELLSKNF